MVEAVHERRMRTTARLLVLSGLASPRSSVTSRRCKKAFALAGEGSGQEAHAR